ncbi:MAG TPA: DegQ family serine endoprotease [Crenotrichaceae bacterium]|nr:DegQ family serine endoprotease [Crenotrichaceae bacterium]
MKSSLIKYLFLILWLITISAFAEDAGIENLRITSKAFASIARKVSPSVVFIQVESTKAVPSLQQFSTPFGPGGSLNDDLLKHFFGNQFRGFQQTPQPGAQQQERRVMGQGSGFVFKVESGLLSNKSYIMTNNHVVDHADKIRVKFKDGKEYIARLKGTDPKSDIAVLEVDANIAPALPLGNSSRLEVGEWVVAIGNPFGLSHTLTVGVVSAKGRSSVGINDYENFIQTDAAINPGNSGGPLLNLDAEVVGMNTAIFSRSGGSMGIGFAIPINLAKQIAEQLIEKGEVTRGHLGIVIQQLTPELAESFGVEPGEGILVAQVSDNSPAQKAGVKQGDIILSYKGSAVDNVGRFRNSVALTTPGSKAKLVVLRDGKHKTLTVQIGKQEKGIQLTDRSKQDADEIGITVQTITSQLAEQFNIEQGKGVVITRVEPNSIAARAGIRPGTVILQANRKPVNSTADFRRIVKDSSAKKMLLLLVREAGSQRFIALNW